MSPADPINTARFPELFRDEVFRLETRRLWLRWPKATDVPLLGEIVAVAACAHDGVKWPLAWDGQAGSVPAMVLRMRAANASGEGCFLALADKAHPEKPIGLIGIDATLAERSGENPDATLPDGASLGFLLDVRRQGYGLMTEAARALVGAALMYSGLESIRGDAGMSGLGARRLLEKAGFRPAGPRVPADVPLSTLVARREAGTKPAYRARRESSAAATGAAETTSCGAC